MSLQTPMTLKMLKKKPKSTQIKSNEETKIEEIYFNLDDLINLRKITKMNVTTVNDIELIILKFKNYRQITNDEINTVPHKMSNIYITSNEIAQFIIKTSNTMYPTVKSSPRIFYKFQIEMFTILYDAMYNITMSSQVIIIRKKKNIKLIGILVINHPADILQNMGKYIEFNLEQQALKLLNKMIVLKEKLFDIYCKYDISTETDTIVLKIYENFADKIRKDLQDKFKKSPLKEELMAVVWHPRNFEKFKYLDPEEFGDEYI
jgi:hypothetical protein